MNVGTAEQGKKAGQSKKKAAGLAIGEGKAEAKGGDGKGKVEGQIGRMLVRAIWAQEWSLANPEGKGEDRKAAWKDAREAAMEKNLKTYRRAINTLTRGGVTMTLSEVAAKAGEDADLNSED